MSARILKLKAHFDKKFISIDILSTIYLFISFHDLLFEILIIQLYGFRFYLETCLETLLKCENKVLIINSKIFYIET